VALAGADALALGVSNGDRLKVEANGHHVTLPARVDDVLPHGVVAIPRNLQGLPAESLLGEREVFGRVKVARA
jgi:anaerobic selenocysteine-containing dehydrogenase